MLSSAPANIYTLPSLCFCRQSPSMWLCSRCFFFLFVSVNLTSTRVTCKRDPQLKNCLSIGLSSMPWLMFEVGKLSPMWVVLTWEAQPHVGGATLGSPAPCVQCHLGWVVLGCIRARESHGVKPVNTIPQSSLLTKFPALASLDDDCNPEAERNP